MEVNYDICEMLDDKMMEYSAYVILHRALPSLEDGFKVSLRRILYTMYKENMTKLTKSANVSGQVMKIHPHSDCYPTIVNMVQTDSHSNPFIIGKGAFAYHTSRDTQAASSRYSEIKIAPYSQEMMEGIKKNSVEMIPTFDGSSKEPLYLPVKHPNILTHSQTGMGVGMATNFPSFNLGEVCDYTISYLKDDSLTNLVPDFPTGGKIIFNQSQIEKINNTGYGSVDIQANYEVDGDTIIINEVPFTTTREVIIEKIIDMVKNGKLKEITNVIDTTDLSGMSIEIKVKKNVDADLLMQKLFKLTSLQSSFSANMNCLVNNRPQVLGVKSIIEEWVKFRKQCLERELLFDIDKIEEECNKLMGLETILSNLDEAIAIIRGSKSESEAMDKLQNHFKLNQQQVEYICTIKLINMNNEWLSKKISKLGEITDELRKMRDNLESDDYYTQTIISQLHDVKAKYGKKRKTTIIHEHEVETISDDILIENFNNQVVLTKEGYFKRTMKYSDSNKVKENDYVIQQIPSTNKSKLLFFTDKANCYYLNAWDISTVQPSVLGSYLPTLLQLQDENIIYMVSTEDFNGNMLFAFKNGKVAKVTLSSYATKTNRTKIINAFNTESPLVSIHYIEKDCDFEAVSSINKVLVVDTSQINSKSSKNSQGVGVLKSKNKSIMVEFKPSPFVNDIEEAIKEYYKANIPATGKYRK